MKRELSPEAISRISSASKMLDSGEAAHEVLTVFYWLAYMDGALEMSATHIDNLREALEEAA